MTNININNLRATNTAEEYVLNLLRSGRQPRGEAREIAIEMAMRAELERGEGAKRLTFFAPTL